MSEELKSCIIIVVAIALGIFSFFGRLRVLTRKQKFVEKAKRSGNFTEAECVDVKRYSNFGTRDNEKASVRSDLLKVKYRYRVKGIDYYKKYSFQSPGKVSIDYPYSITMYYNPRRPKRVVSSLDVSQSDQMSMGCLTAIIVTILSILVFGYFLGI